jgi:hypothetical protein
VLPGPGERVRPVGQEGGRAGHACSFRAGLVDQDPPGELDARVGRQQRRQPGLQQVRASVDRILDYAWLEGTDPGGLSYEDYRAFLTAVGFRELTRTQRGWSRESAAPA